ncbi:S24 family peptidase [Enterococcus faecalis]
MNVDKIRMTLLHKREQKGLSAEALGKMVGVNKTTIYRYEKGQIEKMPFTVVNRLAEVLEINPAFIAGFSDEPDIGTPTTITMLIKTTAKLEEKRQKRVLNCAEEELKEQEHAKLISLEKKRKEKDRFSQDRKGEKRGVVGAGLGVSNFYEDIVDEDRHEWPTIPIPDDAPSDFDWVYVASGDSMEPLFQDEDIVYVKALDDYERSNLDTDTIYAIRVDGASYLKKIRITEHGMYLVSLNKEYDDILVSEYSDIKVVGKVVL